MTTRRAAVQLTFRRAIRRPAHLVIGSATVAIAVGVFFATFALVDGLLFTPPAFAHHREVVLYGEVVREGSPRSVAASTYGAIGLPQGVLSRGLARAVERGSARHGSHAGLLAIQRIDAGFLPTLGVIPALGTVSLEAAGRDGVLVSWRLWQAWFQGRAAIGGQAIILDGQVRPVVGVLPARYRLFDDVDVLLPLRTSPGAAGTVPNYLAVARLAPDVAAQAFAAHVNAIGAQAGAAPGRYGVTPIDDALTESAAPTLWFFLGCAIMVLATACGNLANLVLARALGRSQETALRRALGAGWWGTWSATALEAVLIAVGGLVAGCVIGHAVVRAAEGFIPDPWRINAGSLDVGWRVYAASAIAAAVTAAMATVGGTLHEQGDALLRRYAGGGVASGHGVAVGIRVAMVQFQLALATVLLSMCVVRIVLAWHVQEVPPGFEPAGAMAMRFRPDPGHFGDAGALADAIATVDRRAAAMRSVTAAGVTTQLPAGTNFTVAFAGTDGHPVETQLALQTGGARAALGLHLASGRDLDVTDTAAAPAAIVVNRAFLAAIPGAVLGGIVHKVSRSLGDRDLRIVGIVDDTRDAGPAAPPRPLAIMPFAQLPGPEFESFRSLLSYYLVLRGMDDIGIAGVDASTAIRPVAPWLAFEGPRPLAWAWREARAAIDRDTWLATWFAAVGLGVGLVGLYSAQRVEVASRRRDLGLCAALGARPSDLLGMCLARGMARASVGVGLGLAMAFAWSYRPPLGLAPDIRLDPASALLVAVAMLVLTSVAALAPAWRSAATPASVVLRHP